MTPRASAMAHFPAEAADSAAFEEVLACNIKDVVADLCLTDAHLIMSYATNELHGNIDEIITSSCELYFKKNTLTYGHAADVSFVWGTHPNVVLDMEFVHEVLAVFFKLVLAGDYVGVQISKVLVEGHVEGGFDAWDFARVLTSARICPLPSRYEPSRLGRRPDLPVL